MVDGVELPMQTFTGQCRICLAEDQPGLIEPCGCRGSAALVHRECLTRWQKRQRNITRCEVCHVAWTVQLEAVDRDCWVRVPPPPLVPPSPFTSGHEGMRVLRNWRRAVVALLSGESHQDEPSLPAPRGEGSAVRHAGRRASADAARLPHRSDSQSCRTNRRAGGLVSTQVMILA